MNAAFSLQDCDRKAPPQTFTVTFVDNKPAGIDVKFSRGIDPRTRQPNTYTVSLTPAVGLGTWETREETGDIEQVKRFVQPNCIRVEGMWVESGSRQIMVLELPVV